MMKEDAKDVLLEAIQRRSEQKVGQLSTELVHAASEEKEAVLAGLEIERWLADTCRNCLKRPMSDFRIGLG